MQGNILRRFFAPEFLVKENQRLGELPDGKTAYRNAMQIALPSMIEMVLMSLIGSIDTMMVGNFLGAEALSSVGLPTQPRMIFLCLITALNVGVTAIVARRKGEGRRDSANSTLRNALMLALGLSFVLMVIGVVFASPVIRISGGDQAESEKVFNDAVAYFRIMIAALPINAVSLCICAAQRGIGKTKITMWVNMASNLVNVFFNYCLIGGNLGFPRLEVRGAAIASVIGMTVGMVLALCTVFSGGKKEGYLHFSIRDKWRFEKDALRSIIRVGSNAALETVGIRIGFFLSSRMIFSLGTAMYAAHQICLQVLTLTYTFGEGLGVAATALIGQNMGKGRPDLSMLYGKICQRYSLIISLIVASCISIFRWNISGWFIGAETANAEQVLAFAASAMLVAALYQPFQTSAVTLSGCLRGAGDNLYVAAVGTGCISIIRPLFIYLGVSVFHMDLAGTWLLGYSDLFWRAVLLYPRFAGGKWKNKKV